LKVLVIDNYDSFVYNLVQYIGEQGGDPLVYRNNQISLERAIKIRPERILISPGPGDPRNPRYFGVCSKILKRMSPQIPTLGVCLGHQGIIATYGGQVVRAGRIVHGKPSPIKHDGKGLYKDIENPLEATRYHSLVGDRDTIPPCLEVTATALDDGEIMGVRHKKFPIEGIQFHPESILTLPGKRMIANFIGDVTR
jgi:anthranilate synthase component 2